MRVLVVCEFSSVVRDAFAARGHDAWSCDLLPSERPGNHIQGDAGPHLSGWDLVIAHPPCTYLSKSGVRWLHERPERWPMMIAAAVFFRRILEAPVPRIAVENPVLHGYATSIIGRRADQYIQPWQFGHGETKRTGLWLKNLTPLTPTRIVEGRTPRVHFAAPGPDRWKERSRTYEGIAEAMADQWG
jgi:hypothetical protein